MTLVERLKIVMDAMKWTHADLVRVSGQSSSVVSQWLGKSSKIIKTIGKLEAAEAIEQASGFCALWIAKGIGPQRVSPPHVAEPPAPYGSPSPAAEVVAQDQHEIDLLRAYRALPGDEQYELVMHAMSRAEFYKKQVEQLLAERFKVTGYKTDEHVAQSLPAAPPPPPPQTGLMAVRPRPAPGPKKQEPRRSLK